jgi:glycosyltransferase involved in cell wall biosynthesis
MKKVDSNPSIAPTPQLPTVVVINDNASVTGGADKIALTSVAELAKRGHRVFLLTAVGELPREYAEIPGLTVVSTEQYDLLGNPSRLNAAVQGLWNTKSAKVAAELFDSLDTRTTIVHVHLWAKALSSSVVKAAIARNFQVVITIHDYLLACPTGTLFIHPQKQICHIKPMSLECICTNCDSRTYADKLWRVARQSIQAKIGGMPGRVKHFIGISDLSLNVMRGNLPAGATLYRVSNFVDMPWRPPAPVFENQTFVYTGRLVREKGPVLFAQAAESMKVPALFIGEGSSHEEVLAANPRAEITGWLPYNKIQERLRSARAFVFPSRWYEVQPLVILEAIANGIPCIVADTSAAREMIADGETGFWFKGGSASDLADKIHLLKDPALAAQLGKTAHQRYWAHPHTVERHIRDLERVYGEMLRSVQA